MTLYKERIDMGDNVDQVTQDLIQKLFNGQDIRGMSIRQSRGS